MSIDIVQVNTAKQMRQFVRFYDALYKDTWQYVPPLHNGEKKFYDKEQNKSHSYCDSVCFLAYKDGKVVGRIGGILNHRYNEKVDRKQLRFTTFDFIDDLKVSKALLETLGEWGLAKGMEEFNGPIGFTDFDRQGMLVEGFDKPGMYITNYNYSYYPEHMAKLGFETDVEWQEFLVKTPTTVHPRHAKIAKRMRELGYHIVRFDSNKEFNKVVYEAFEVYNAAFAKLHGVVPLTKEQIKMYVDDYIGLINRDYVIIVRDAKERIVAFALLAGSLYEAARKAKGHLFPFGWVSIVKAFKRPKECLDMYWIAVLPELQGLGIPSLILEEVASKMIRDGIKWAETGPQLVDNLPVMSLWDDFEYEIVRRRRCYQRKIREEVS